MQSPGPHPERCSGVNICCWFLVLPWALPFALGTHVFGCSGVLLPLSTPVVPLTPVQPLSWWLWRGQSAGLVSLCQEPAQGDIASGHLSCVSFSGPGEPEDGLGGRESPAQPQPCLQRRDLSLCTAQGCAGSWLCLAASQTSRGPRGLLKLIAFLSEASESRLPTFNSNLLNNSPGNN